MAHAPRHAVILAGGPGSRLWPASRRSRPKFVLPLLPGRPSSLVDTWDRVTPIVGADHVWIVTGADYSAAVIAELPDLAPERLLVEPSSKDSLPALALAAEAIARTCRDALVATVPADNHATDLQAFAVALESAFTSAANGAICAIGLAPKSASSAFGYIEVDGPIEPGSTSALRAVAFTEKPPESLAQSYYSSGRHLWNGGIYVSSAEILVAEIERLRPDVLAAVGATGSNSHPDLAAWNALKPISIDHGISERLADEGRLSVVPAEFGWQDTGDFASLFAVLAEDGVAVSDPSSVQLVDSSGLVLSMPGRTISVLGIDNIVVVDTPDALLVTTLADAQKVRDVVEGWRERHRDDLL